MSNCVNLRLRRVVPLLVTGLLACSDSRDADDFNAPPNPYPFSDWRIAEGAAVSGKLWLRSGDDRVGEGLVAIDLSTGIRTTPFEHDVIDIEGADGRLWALRGSAPSVPLTISVSKGETFEDFATLALPVGDAPKAFLVRDGRPVIFSSRAIRIWSKVRNFFDTTTFQSDVVDAIEGRITIGMPNDMSAVYVGHNAGEFAGGLQRIDLSTGAVTEVERNDGRKYPLLGPLVSPRVTGIIADPADAACVLVANGLVHFVSSGNIVRVCGQNVRVAYENIVEVDGFQKGIKDKVSEAIFGLAPHVNGGYWAVGVLGVYEFVPGRLEPIRHDIPKLISVGGVRLSHAIPHVIVLRTDINAMFSLSGFTPLVVPIDE